MLIETTVEFMNVCFLVFPCVLLSCSVHSFVVLIGTRLSFSCMIIIFVINCFLIL
jgi:hypothetical protein